ncbi:MAG: Gfo/Idh/MocA family protein, partial [Limisphaerales bacterium]
ESAPTRRQFVQSTALVAGAGLSTQIITPAKAATPITGRIKIGLIGCGGRGTGATVQAMKADSRTELWAVADLFPEQIEKTQGVVKAEFGKDPQRIRLNDSRKFTGLDAHAKLLASDIDLVLIATPGGFRPYHLKAAVAAGKHIFCEKPMAVDPHGIRLVIEAVAEAKEKNLAIRAGFNMRFQPAYREAIRRIRDGEIGEIRSVYSTRMSSRLARFDGIRKPEQGDLEYQLRNWHYFNWLSGDLILEISVHSIDKMAWIMGDKAPTRVIASGARHQQTLGDIWDQFDVTYEYENGLVAILKTRYLTGCHNEHKDLVIGTKGTCELGWGTATIRGENSWRYKGPKVSSHQIEHDELYADLRQGIVPNDGDRMVNSTLMGIAGRMSAYTGKAVTWKQALESKLKTMPDKLDWDMKFPEPVPAQPGKTRLI